MTKQRTPFEVLSQINVNDSVKVKPNASKAKYLPWSNAWSEVKQQFPDATWKVVEYFTGNDSGMNVPYCATEIGIMVKTEVTIDGQTQSCMLPVLNSRNSALKTTPYTIKTKYGDTVVAAATMFDINTTIMRCLVKNIAMFGLGLYIYTDDTMPEAYQEERKTASKKTRPVVTADHELYAQVVKFVKDNAKKKDWSLIMKQLKTKYSLASDVLNELTKIYNDAK